MATAGTMQQSSASRKPGLRKPVFIKVDQLKPGTNGHTLTVKVISSDMVLQKGRSVSHHLRQTRIAECLVGDQTGTIVFTARNEQGTVRLGVLCIWVYVFDSCSVYISKLFVFEFFCGRLWNGFCSVIGWQRNERRQRERILLEFEWTNVGRGF